MLRAAMRCDANRICKNERGKELLAACKQGQTLTGRLKPGEEECVERVMREECERGQGLERG